VAVPTGLTATVSSTVGPESTARAVGSGDVDVWATPSVIALAEQATVTAVAPVLEPGQTTVGNEVQITHLAPTAVGARVRAEAVLESVEGRRLSFRVTVSDANGLVAAGYINRVVVDRARFMDRLTPT
jgi:fluoroacetyl-CoA thioesterase